MARDISAVAAQLQRSLSPGQVLCGRTDEQSRHRAWLIPCTPTRFSSPNTGFCRNSRSKPNHSLLL